MMIIAMKQKEGILKNAIYGAFNGDQKYHGRKRYECHFSFCLDHNDRGLFKLKSSLIKGN